MNENVKSIFFVSVLILLLLGISAVTAADNDTVTSNDIISDTPEVASSDAIVTEDVQIASENTVETNAKNIEKENKNIKTSTQAVTVNNFNELQTAWTDMQNTEADEFIINLNDGDYRFNSDLNSYMFKSINIILNGNNQIFTANEGWEDLSFPQTANVTINNLTQNISFNAHGNTYLNNIIINGSIYNNGENISFDNCTLNNTISNSGILTITDNCLFGENLVFDNWGGEIKINDSDKLLPYYYTYEGNYTLENVNIPNERFNHGNLSLINSNINGRLENNGNLTIRNSTLNSSISNFGNLTICDDVIFGLNFSIYNYGEITMNDSEKLLPFIGGYHDGNYIIENVNIITPRTNQANVTFKNCTLNCEIYNEGNLTINDDCIFGENLCIDNQPKGNIIINDTDSLIPYYSTYDNGNYTIENVVIGGQKTIRWNSTVTIINATINSNISNMGNVIIINSTINSTIQNNQNLTMQGICIFGENYYLNNYGNFINETKDIPIEEPTENTVIITPETIDILISEYGSYDNFIENYTYLFQGNFKNTTTTPLYISIWNTNHRSNITLDGTNATFTNTVLAIDGTNIRIQNMKINNTNAYGQIISLSGTANNIQIINNNFSITNNINENYPFSPRTRILKTHLAKNILIENNTFLITAPTTEAIQQVDWPNINTANPVAIVCGKTTNITITNNYIGITNNIETTDNGIDGITITNSANVQITKNTINITGSNNITPINTIDTEQTTIENNTIIEPEIQKETTLKVYLTTMIIGQTVKIQSDICYGDEIQSNITKGKITFKVNGKTLKDANGKTIYAKVVNGTAVIENYIVPKDWSKDGTTIQAVYSGSSQLEKLTSEKTEITIEKIMPTLSTYEIQATAGSTITLTATLNDNTINTGKIVFKINGKTVKDANGKVIYSKVVNGTVSVEYNLPANMKSKEYNITAVFTSSEYDRLEDTKILTVN